MQEVCASLAPAPAVEPRPPRRQAGAHFQAVLGAVAVHRRCWEGWVRRRCRYLQSNRPRVRDASGLRRPV